MREGDPQRRPSLLGQRLVAQGLLEPAELRQVLALQDRLPPDEPVRRLGSLLVQSGRLSMRQLADALGAQRRVLPSSGVATQVPEALRTLFPIDLLYEVGAAPLCLIGKTLAIAMVDANDGELVARLQRLTDYHVRPMMAPQLQVHRLLQSIPQAAPPRPRPVREAPRPAPTPVRAAPPPRRRSLRSQTMLVSIIVWSAVALLGLTAVGVHLKLRRDAQAHRAGT